jgi:hypothetical protein
MEFASYFFLVLTRRQARQLFYGEQKKYPGADRTLSLIEGMYTNCLEDRSSPSPCRVSLSPIKIHITRSPDAKSIHEAWIHTLSSTSLRLYTDGSKSSTGTAGSGWALFGTQNIPFQNINIATAACYLRNEAEVFEAELHAIHEGLLYLDARNLFICIDNTAAIKTLQENLKQSEPAREASKVAYSLFKKGLNVSTI